MLRAVSERDAYANLALPALLRERDITGRDAAFASELTYGTCRARGLLDAIIAHVADRPVERIDPVLLDLLRLGAYQLLRTRVEQHAAVATTVDQAKVEFDAARGGFVNAVLRKIAARGEQSWVAELAPDRQADPIGHAAFTHAHPRWVAQSFADALGADAGELTALLAADDDRPLVHLAARPGVLSAAELADQVDGTVGRYSPYAVYLPGGDPGGLAAVQAGTALVQDEGSQLVAQALTRAPVSGDDGGRWLDLCAGQAARPRWSRRSAPPPGPGSPRWNPPRGAEMVRENARGLDVEVLEVDGRDAARLLTGGAAKFDRVLVDAPCTGLGRCGAGPRRGGGGHRPTCRRWPSCNGNCSPRRSR